MCIHVCVSVCVCYACIHAGLCVGGNVIMFGCTVRVV